MLQKQLAHQQLTKLYEYKLHENSQSRLIRPPLISHFHLVHHFSLDILQCQPM